MPSMLVRNSMVQLVDMGLVLPQCPVFKSFLLLSTEGGGLACCNGVLLHAIKRHLYPG